MRGWSAESEVYKRQAQARIERIVGRGWSNLNLHSASALLDQGQASVNLVAAIPSLHAGMSAALAAFLWHRVHRAWRPLLVAYPLVMAFTLVYTAEHYVIDLLPGWALAAVAIAGRTMPVPRSPPPPPPIRPAGRSQCARPCQPACTPTPRGRPPTARPLPEHPCCAGTAQSRPA